MILFVMIVIVLIIMAIVILTAAIPFVDVLVCITMIYGIYKLVTCLKKRSKKEES